MLSQEKLNILLLKPKSGMAIKVLFISRKWPPAIGGMETYACELARELAKMTDVRLYVLPGRPNGLPPTGFSIAWFGVRTACLLLLHERRHDVVHGADMALWPLVLLAKATSRSATLVLSAHGTDVSFGDRSGIAPTLYRAYLKVGALLLRKARVVANSRYTASRAQARGFSQVAVVPLAGRVVEHRHPSAPKPYVLFVGRPVPQKGLQWFVDEVLPSLPEEFSLHVVSPSPHPEDIHAGTAQRVAYLGPVGGNVLATMMAEALCVVVPNIPLEPGYTEGFGLVAVEAAAAGGVVLASRLDGLTDSIIDGETGFLLEPKSSRAWADAVLGIASWSPETRRTFIDRAQAKCRLAYSWERVARETYGVYERALAQFEKLPAEPNQPPIY